METFEKHKIEDVTLNDLINSAATFKAREAGYFGKAKLQEEEIGVFGAAMSDIQETTAKLADKKITAEEAKEEIKWTLWTVVKTYLHGLVDILVEPIAIQIKLVVPIFSKVIDGVKEFVKVKIVDYAVDKVREYGTKLFNWGKQKLSYLVD